MSLAEKIGQLFIVGFEGTAVTPDLDAWLATHDWGGVIIFGRNVESPTQLLLLTQGLQAAVRGRGRPPLLIAVDQEGGRVARLKAPFTAFPSAAVVGQAGAEDLAYNVGRTLATELSAVGITMDMAPVLDVLSNPRNSVIGDRAFGTDPDRVGHLGTAFMHGLHAAGIIAVGKHFPGHGDTVLDSHVALPVCERCLDQLHACELRPFAAALAAGLEVIMTAHVVYPAWDVERPATLSAAILTGVLRETMGFRGVIISDDLGMAAVSETMPWEEVPVQALRAGVDLLLICHQREQQEQAYVRVLRAVQSGELDESLVDRAVARIRQLKARLSHQVQATPNLASLARIGTPEHLALAASIRTQATPQALRRETHGV